MTTTPTKTTSQLERALQTVLPKYFQALETQFYKKLTEDETARAVLDFVTDDLDRAVHEQRYDAAIQEYNTFAELWLGASLNGLKPYATPANGYTRLPFIRIGDSIPGTALDLNAFRVVPHNPRQNINTVPSTSISR